MFHTRSIWGRTGELRIQGARLRLFTMRISSNEVQVRPRCFS